MRGWEREGTPHFSLSGWGAMKNPEYRPSGPAMPSVEGLELDLSGWLNQFADMPEGLHEYVLLNKPSGSARAVVAFNHSRKAVGCIVQYDNPPAGFHGKPGMVYLYVHRFARGQKLATQLLRRAIDLWDIRVENQPFTAAGAEVTNQFVEKMLGELGE